MDLMILEGFSNLSDSMILCPQFSPTWHESIRAQQHCGDGDPGSSRVGWTLHCVNMPEV